jgi:hypothetical protein
MQVRIRPGFYPNEAYLDIHWTAEPGQHRSSGEISIVHAMKELRGRGVLPESAALAYIADQPWAGGPVEAKEGGIDWEACTGLLEQRLAEGEAAARKFLERKEWI